MLSICAKTSNGKNSKLFFIIPLIKLITQIIPKKDERGINEEETGKRLGKEGEETGKMERKV
jgi:hypothetical protein